MKVLQKIFGFFRRKSEAHLPIPPAPDSDINTTIRTAEGLELLIGTMCDGDRRWQGLRDSITVPGVQRLRNMADRLGAA